MYEGTGRAPRACIESKRKDAERRRRTTDEQEETAERDLEEMEEESVTGLVSEDKKREGDTKSGDLSKAPCACTSPSGPTPA